MFNVDVFKENKWGFSHPSYERDIAATMEARDIFDASEWKD